jgi:hypothetical protein
LLGEGCLSDSLEDCTWLFRGVPAESPEVDDVGSIEEVRPPRPDRIGADWRLRHCAGMTQTGYTSWSTDRSIAEAAAGACSDDEGLCGQIRIFRVRISTLDMERVFEGRADEDEYLIEGTVENVEFSEGATDEEDDD